MPANRLQEPAGREKRQIYFGIWMISWFVLIDFALYAPLVQWHLPIYYTVIGCAAFVNLMTILALFFVEDIL